MSTAHTSKRRPWTIYFREDLKAALVAIEPESTSQLLESIVAGYLAGKSVRLGARALSPQEGDSMGVKQDQEGDKRVPGVDGRQPAPLSFSNPPMPTEQKDLIDYEGVKPIRRSLKDHELTEEDMPKHTCSILKPEGGGEQDLGESMKNKGAANLLDRTDRQPLANSGGKLL